MILVTVIAPFISHRYFFVKKKKELHKICELEFAGILVVSLNILFLLSFSPASHTLKGKEHETKQ